MAKASNDITILGAEAEHFGTLAADWWNPKGSSAMLHKLNPVRLAFIRRVIDDFFGTDPQLRQPILDKNIVDVGCGAGLLCEPLARLGGNIYGVDAAGENIAVARDHAANSGLKISYHHGEIGQIKLPFMDIVSSMEVLEHVLDPQIFLRQLADKLKSDGLMLLSTPNRTTASRLFLVEAAERFGMVPRGTHDWNKFIKPDELGQMLDNIGMEIIDMRGIGFSPAKGLHLSDNIDLNYILSAKFK
ncbi:bifunctional 3-demethylubiquinol 3-O-methyltransferase/2-polyprenyl-6-hydroxyphenol methylase [Sphingorhabdus lutea]|uniref:Ubiquinone biosynthesis O-methyltransferase n=1 Tax=Sphingorhabdus lutea TaxID=1913578 RepID=A0A1L3JD44_9SPHN|nr:bifunctional 2-polyprenyl-6-hydroxyphenol methylase/3-demethylubiquinol 3-O-methyltransferase UbiG [Sphingorhabdus lutea]APG63061.1 bifunctional 3-demethylubiquinol 3-O-methyltransferase/2-polyprenyl-6-hydroxyphenol methylase [Sphingorhabdus lutea]